MFRKQMKERQLDAFIIPSTDPHSGEYVPDHWKTREWISGFTGSAGIAVVTTKEAGLWTDSRYFIQAEDQLKGTGFRLFKERLPETPTITEWLGNVLQEKNNVGIDGWVNSHQNALSIQKELKQYGLSLKVMTEDIFDNIWENRPSLPQAPVFILDSTYTEFSCSEKISRIQESIAQNGSSAILLSALDEIAWTLNLRGEDVHCNPVFISYLLISTKDYTLYIIENKITDEVKDYLNKHQIKIRPYNSLPEDLHSLSGQLQMSPSTNEALYNLATR